MGYTPNYEAKNFDPRDSDDRPFAGWLYSEYSQYYIYKKAYFSVGIKLGVVGESAQAGDVQNEFHKLTGFEFVPGWETQVPNFFGFDFVGSYQNIILNKDYGFFYYKGNISLGTVNTNVDNRLGIAFGRNPTPFGFTRLANETETNSFFVQFDGGINYTYHDATLEGNPFTKRKFLVDQEFDNSTIVFSFSVKYLTDRWALIYNGTYESEVVNGSSSHRFGRVSVIRAF